MSAHMKKHLTSIKVEGKSYKVTTTQKRSILTLVKGLDEKATNIDSEKVMKEIYKDRPRYSVNLKTARTRENISQEFLAEKLGVSKTIISMYERGQRRIPEDMAKKLAKVLKTSYRLLLDN